MVGFRTGQVAHLLLPAERSVNEATVEERVRVLGARALHDEH